MRSSAAQADGTDVSRSVPAGYLDTLEQLKVAVRDARVRTHRSVNTEVLTLYWSIGSTIARAQQREGWGTRVVERLGDDLRAEFPAMRGLSRTNLFYMRAFYETWPALDGVVPHAVGQLPWGHVRCLLDKLDTRTDRDWYATAAAEHGWSRDVLLKIKSREIGARGAAPTNFHSTLREGSDAAAELVRDPYTFDFLGLTDKVSERDLANALMHRLERFLLELGAGFAFVGRQVHLTVGASDFHLDLLFFHVAQLRYVVLELKIGAFRPDHVGQLGFYVSAVDDLVRDHRIHQRTVGILLCADRDDQVVRYSLAGANAPLAVSTYRSTSYQPPSAERFPPKPSLPKPSPRRLRTRAPYDAPMPEARKARHRDERLPCQRRERRC